MKIFTFLNQISHNIFANFNEKKTYFWSLNFLKECRVIASISCIIQRCRLYRWYISGQINFRFYFCLYTFCMNFQTKKSSKIKMFGMTALTKKIKVRPEKFYRSDVMINICEAFELNFNHIFRRSWNMFAVGSIFSEQAENFAGLSLKYTGRGVQAKILAGVFRGREGIINTYMVCTYIHHLSLYIYIYI